MVQKIRTVADKCKEHQEVSSHHRHLRVTDVERRTARHVDAERAKGLCFAAGQELSIRDHCSTCSTKRNMEASPLSLDCSRQAPFRQILRVRDDRIPRRERAPINLRTEFVISKTSLASLVKAG